MGMQGPIEKGAELLTVGRPGEAREALLHALRKHPRDADVHRLLAIASSNLGDLAGAAFYAGRAAELGGADASLLVLHANALFNAGRSAEAAAVFRRGLAADPANMELRAGLCEVLFQDGQFNAVVDECRAGLRHGDDAGLSSVLGAALANMGELDEAYRVMLGARERWPEDLSAASAAAQMTLYMPGLAAEDVTRAHRCFGDVLRRLVGPAVRASVRDPRPERRLRVGFVSGDFRTHSVAYFFEPLLEALKTWHPAEVECWCYYTSVTEDHVTHRLRALADGWREVATLELPQLDALVRADAMDVLVDLGGHTNARVLPLMQRAPAPIQMTYLGYPATTGVEAIDFRVVDSMTDPLGRESQCVERLIRLDPCFLCYRPPAAADITMTARRSGDGLVFGSFNMLQKVNDPLLHLWKRVIDAVPGSKLLLKNHGLEAETRPRMTARLADAGFAPQQFELLGRQGSMSDHLRTYGRVDIALDTFPYHGTTTTCEALWMGVPVVTLAGEMHTGRVGVSLLNAVGLQDLVAENEDHFVQIAASLAQDVARRRQLRSELRERMRASPLRDERGYAARFAELIRALWRAACDRHLG